MDGFDLDRYLRASGRLDLDAFAWGEVAAHSLSADEARCLRYMMDIESHTAIYLRDLLATPAADDPDVTAFLSCWAYEEMWHGEAFSRLLGEAGYRLGPDGERPLATAPYPTRRARNRAVRHRYGGGASLSHIITMAGAALLREDFVAIHMTWGAVNELSTLTGYERLMARTQHPVLRPLLARIMKDERRHFAFYRAQARLRLRHSRRAQRMTRWALRRFWAPVGTGVTPQAETDAVVAFLFGDAAGAAAAQAMDDVVTHLPGLAGLRIVQDARGAALRRAAPRLSGVAA